jgi:CheY-like chemotaxis protein
MMDKETNSARKNFIRSITHAFKKPLDDSIIQLAKIKKNHEDDPKLSQSLFAVEHKLSQIQNDMSNLVLLSSLTCDTYTQTFASIKPLEFFEAISQAWIEKAKVKSLKPFIYIDANLPMAIDIDQVTLEHALFQLMENAIKFTPKHGSVYLDIRQSQQNGKDVISFSVTDTGIGIVKAKIPKLIQPFGTPTNTGAGLGLSSTFYLLRKVGSDLKISSEVSKGSRFSFILPFRAKENTPLVPRKSIYVGILQDADDMADYTRQLFSYLVGIGTKLISIEDVKDPKLAKCQALFIIDKKFDRNKKSQIRHNYPNCVVVPTFLDKFDKAYDITKDLKDYKLLLPILPSSIISTFAYIKEELAFIAEKNERENQGQEALENLAEKSEEHQEDQPLQILLVEDNAINIKWTLMLLGRYDYDITFAENGEIAVSMVKQKRFDLILMDIDMPIMNGIEATRHIKAYEKEAGLKYTPIVALTSHDQEGEREEIMAQGLDEHLGKPLKLSELEAIFTKYDPKKRTLTL